MFLVNERGKRIVIFASVVFTMLVYKYAFHELWKDEWQAWLDVRDMSITEMLSFLNYEGHPALYYLLLIPFKGLISLFQDQQEHIIQLAHWLMYAITMAVFLFRFKLQWWIKLLFSLGYFMWFEYGVVNRAYILVLLFAFVITSEIVRKKNGVLLVASFFLICQTEVYGVLMGGGFLLYMVIQDSKLDVGSIMTSIRGNRRSILA